jgi:hypothetical protein
MLNKKCDNCGKLIEQKEGQTGYSEWCLYHFQKRRDFDSKACFLEWIIDYFKEELSVSNLMQRIVYINELEKLKAEITKFQNDYKIKDEAVKGDEKWRKLV